MLLKCCSQYVSKPGKLSSGHRTGKSQFHSNFKERQCQECSNYCTIVLISHASKVMLKIVQVWCQQYVNPEFPGIKVEFRNSQGTRYQVANIPCIIKKATEFQWSRNSASLTTLKPLTVDNKKLWKILKEMGLQDHLTCLLRNLYLGQQATVRTGHGTTNWFQIGKGEWQDCILSHCLYNLYAEYIMQNLGWMSHKLESKVLGEIQITSNMQMIPR